MDVEVGEFQGFFGFGFDLKMPVSGRSIIAEIRSFFQSTARVDKTVHLAILRANLIEEE
ncbi:MAG: hypothetical protein ACM3NH_02470 [Candidatus Saccharibacteria bacterium]